MFAARIARMALPQARTLATSRAAFEIVKVCECHHQARRRQPPLQPSLQIFSTEGRYSHALFSAASKTKVLETVEKELAQIKARAASDKAFAAFLKTPVLSRKQKRGEFASST